MPTPPADPDPAHDVRPGSRGHGSPPPEPKEDRTTGGPADASEPKPKRPATPEERRELFQELREMGSL